MHPKKFIETQVAILRAAKILENVDFDEYILGLNESEKLAPKLKVPELAEATKNIHVLKNLAIQARDFQKAHYNVILKMKLKPPGEK